jgi:hypothetical protein
MTRWLTQAKLRLKLKVSRLSCSTLPAMRPVRYARANVMSGRARARKCVVPDQSPFGCKAEDPDPAPCFSNMVIPFSMISTAVCSPIVELIMS